ncbi:hypothetical protein [Delftia sp. UGAL515B_04]|uniref:hypothetical protein n=1 Tax=Delftia sp. UGAL515B_04 TaxID=2986766 RepID=UPI0029551D68|nr:hypothetical protein [Delftia sp. UGAL515B_04]WON88679.1 hypothetical protein OK021_28815 [Delftia sp. UGAL515B_04]
MTEREMLEAAARAAGKSQHWVVHSLLQGGYAEELMAALRISVEHNSNTCRQPWVRARIDVSAWEAKVYQEDVPDESQRADRMRLAILRCAAAQAPKEQA